MYEASTIYYMNLYEVYSVPLFWTVKRLEGVLYGCCSAILSIITFICVSFETAIMYFGMLH